MITWMTKRNQGNLQFYNFNLFLAGLQVNINIFLPHGFVQEKQSNSFFFDGIILIIIFSIIVNFSDNLRYSLYHFMSFNLHFFNFLSFQLPIQGSNRFLNLTNSFVDFPNFLLLVYLASLTWKRAAFWGSLTWNSEGSCWVEIQVCILFFPFCIL